MDLSPNVTAKALGVWPQFALGAAWPDLRQRMQTLLAQRVAPIPWLPEGWLNAVQALQASDESALVHVSPGVGVLRPVFCDSQAKADAWQAIHLELDAAVNAYAAGKAAEGAGLIAAANRNATLWNDAYTVAVYIRDLPANAAGAITDAAGDVAGGLLKRLAGSWIVWAAVGILGLVAAWRLGLLKLPKGK